MEDNSNPTKPALAGFFLCLPLTALTLSDSVGTSPAHELCEVKYRIALLAASLLAIVSCSITGHDPDSFAAWHARHHDEAAGLTQYLAERDLAGVLPIHELLRSASSWQQCNAEPFAVPPRQQWESVASVLTLLKYLVSSGVVGSNIEVYSGYRNPDLNACAGGAKASAHATSFALDIKASGSADTASALCDFWRSEGEGWNMGFSIYPSGRIHIDTAGYRTWGYDHTGKSAACPATRTTGKRPDSPGSAGIAILAEK